MEEDIENYSPTFMFRGTPCMHSRAYNPAGQPTDPNSVTTISTKFQT